MCNCYAVREQCGAIKLVEYDSITHTAQVSQEIRLLDVAQE